MPSTSPAQKHLMAAVAHGWHKPGGGGPSVAVAKEFNQADAAMSNKGYVGSTQKFAQGGPVLGKESAFLKTPNEFTENDRAKGTDETWGKGEKSPTTAPAAKGKQLPAVKPKH